MNLFKYIKFYKNTIQANNSFEFNDLSDPENLFSMFSTSIGLTLSLFATKCLSLFWSFSYCISSNLSFLKLKNNDFEADPNEKEKKFITSCIFRLKSEPSALYKCLGGFATNQINLTKLESFSVKNTFDQANFYLDLEGHLDQDRVKKAMEELGFHTVSLHILGVYEASTFRQK